MDGQEDQESTIEDLFDTSSDEIDVVDAERTPGKKRRASTGSEKSDSTDPEESNLGTVLNKIKKATKQASNQAAKLSRSQETSDLSECLEAILSYLSIIITKNGSLRTPGNKKPKHQEVAKTSKTTHKQAVNKRDVGTNTSPPPKKTKVKPNKSGPKMDSRTPTFPRASPGQIRPDQASAGSGPTNVAETTTNNEAFTTVIRKKTTKPENRSPSKGNTTKKTNQKPAAVLVKVGTLSYSDTVRRIREINVDFDTLGTRVTSMRKTAAGDLLVELTKSNKSASAADTIRSRIAETIPETQVKCLGQSVAVEILDLDDVTTKEEVHDAIQKSIGADSNDASVKVTGIWSTKSGRQMATASVPTALASKLTHIRIGWLQCRVRPRRKEPARCYRCHGVGHGTRQCSGPDMTGSCRRCGEPGHIEKTCTAGNDRCVACERIGANRVAHRPGSGACTARRDAFKATSTGKK